VNLYSLLVYIEHNGDESPKDGKGTFHPGTGHEGPGEE